MFLSIPRRRRLRCAPARRAQALLTLLLGACALGLSFLPARAADTNSVVSLRTVVQKTKQTLVEVTLHSTRPFGARDEVIHMDIGKNMYLNSRSPKNGSLYTLIFTMTPAQFKALANRSPIIVSYGHDAQLGDEWDFGTLDKSALDK